MNKPRLWLFITVLAVVALLSGSVYTYAYHSTAGGSIQLKDASGANALGTTPYSPKATCTRVCHASETGLTGDYQHNYGSGDKFSTHVQGVLASGTDTTVYWEASQTKSFEHGVSVGKHMNQGRNEDYTNTYRAAFGDPLFTSSGGMFGKYCPPSNRQLAAKDSDPLGNGLGQLTKSMETGAQDWAFSCGHCHVGGGMMEYDRDRNDYSASSGNGDRYYFKPPTKDAPAGGIHDASVGGMSATNKAEVDCLMCHINDGSGVSGNGRAFLNSMNCATGGAAFFGTPIQLGPNNDPYCALPLASNGTDPTLTSTAMNAYMGMPNNQIGRNGAGMFVPGTKYDTFNRTLAIQSQQYNYAASLGIGAKANLSMAGDGHLHIDSISNAPTTISNSMIAATPSSQNCSICHGRDDNTPGLPGMLNPVRYGYGAYLIIDPKGTTLDVDPTSQASNGTNAVRWMEMGCKTGMGKRGHKTGAGPNDKWGMSMFSVMFNLGKGPGMPILTENLDTPFGPGTLHTTAKMPDYDVHDNYARTENGHTKGDPTGMQCATCHYQLGSTTLEGGSKTIGATVHHGVAYPAETILGIDHNFAQGDSLKDNYGRNHIDDTVSCESCHIDRTHPRIGTGVGQINPPIPTHVGFPALHIQKIGCTTCHIPEIYIQPFKLKYRDYTVGKFKRGTETAGGNKNVYDFSYDFVTASGDAVKQLHQWSNKYGETKIYPITPIEVPNWITVSNNWDLSFGTSATSTHTVGTSTPDPANNNNTTIFNLSTETNAIKTCQLGVKIFWECTTDADCPGISPATGGFPDMNGGGAPIPGACQKGNGANVNPSFSRDIITVAAAAIADGSLQSVRINGGSMVPLFDNWVLTDNLGMDTIAKRNAMRAKSATLFTAGSGKQLQLEKIFHAGFDETHGVAPVEWALGATERGGCANCHSSANSMMPNYSADSVGFFEGVQPYTERANKFVVAPNAPLTDMLVPAIGNMFVGKFDLMKNPMAMFADFDCAGTFCGAGGCGSDGNCDTKNIYSQTGVTGLDMLGSMLVDAGVLPNKAAALGMGFALTPDSYYFNQMTGGLNNAAAACSPYSPLYDLTPMGMPGMGITTIGQCTQLMNAGFDAMMGLPHVVIPVGQPGAGTPMSTAGMMGFSDGIAGLQGLMLRETQNGANMGCNPMAGMKSQADALGFPVNVNNCMPNPAFWVPFDQGASCVSNTCAGGLMNGAPCGTGADCNIMPVGYLFAGTCTGPALPGSGWPASCVNGFRNGASCMVNADCEGALSSSEAGFQFSRDPFGSLGSLMYTRGQQRSHNKTVLQSNGPLDLTWPIFAEKNPGNPAHIAGWDQAAQCLTNVGFMGPAVPCGSNMAGGPYAGYCMGQDGNPAHDICVNVKTYISANDLLGYTSSKVGSLTTGNFNNLSTANCTSCHSTYTQPNHMTGAATPSAPATINGKCTSCHTTYVGGAHSGVTATQANSCTGCHAPKPLSGGATLAHTATATQFRVPPVAVFSSVVTGLKVSVNAGASTCPSGQTPCTYGWTFGDTGTGTGVTTTHTYAGAGTYPVVLTVTSSVGTTATATHNAVTTGALNTAPTVGKGAVVTTGLTVAFKDTSTDDNLGGAGTVYVNWGDGSALSTGAMGSTFTKTYASANTYSIDHYVKDAGGLYSSHDTFQATVPTKYKVTVTASGSLAGALVQIKTIPVPPAAAVTKAQGNTSTSGVYTSLGLDPGNYTMTISKYGYVFDCLPIAGNQNTNLPADLTTGDKAFTCTHTP